MLLLNLSDVFQCVHSFSIHSRGCYLLGEFDHVSYVYCKTKIRCALGHLNESDRGRHILGAADADHDSELG